MCHRNDLFLPQFFGTDERAPVDAAKLRSFANGGDLIESVSKQLKSKQKRELLSDAVREAQLAEAGLLTAANALSALGLRVALGNDRSFPGYRGSDKFYCGRRMAIPGSAGQCGPSAGPRRAAGVPILKSICSLLLLIFTALGLKVPGKK